MIVGWSICQCCGQSAKQRQMYVTRYHPTTDGVQSEQLYVAQKPVRMLPDLCDVCFNDLTSNFQGDEIWFEFERRSQSFRNDFRVLGFKPIIEPTPESLVYSI